jgi:hypothetical protein
VIPASVTKIESWAFAQCDMLTEIICKATTPPVVSKFSFSYEKSTLYVPQEAVETYRNTDYWKEFGTILPIGYLESADVNGDYVVNIADVSIVIDAILSGAFSSSCDVNLDGIVNIADIIAIIDAILNQ